MFIVCYAVAAPPDLTCLRNMLTVSFETLILPRRRSVHRRSLIETDKKAVRVEDSKPNIQFVGNSVSFGLVRAVNEIVSVVFSERKSQRQLEIDDKFEILPERDPHAVIK